MSIVIGSNYSSVRGRKPSRPAFLFDFHNDTAGGTSVTDRFGNAAALALQGTLGTSWTDSRGFWRPNGTDQHALTGTANEYAGQTVLGDALLTSGKALFVAWRLGWPSTKTTTSESVLCVGRNNSTSAVVAFGHNASGILQCTVRGAGASATSAATFGSSGLYTAGPRYAFALHIEQITGGLRVNGWMDGVAVGTQADLLWTANSGAAPALSAFALPDGITIGALRGGSSAGSPSWTQRMGASNTGGTILSNVLAINLAAPDMTLAAALALELHQNPRHVGEIMAAL